MTDGITDPGNNNILQNFSDATAGRSMQLYWCTDVYDSTGWDYVMNRDSGNSRMIYIQHATLFDIDYDITINKPTIFQGQAILDFTFGLNSAAGASACYIVFTVYHYDGVTETALGTVTSETVAKSVDTLMVGKVRIDISRKLFGVGHVLRLNAVGHNNGNGNVVLYMNPQTAGEELKLWMPVVNLE
ncbi:MAG: hypothetical protein KKC46_09450 [Proteobacteria bacterium]|nr:hypothetical protein [Pseudomonadota bacterium]